MIKPMTKYSFVAFHKDTPAFLRMLQELGVMDITRSRKPAASDSRQLFDEIASYKSVLKELQKTQKEAPSSKAELPETRNLTPAKTKEEVFSLSSAIKTLNAELSQLRLDYAEALPWGAFEENAVERIKALGLTPCFVCLPTKKYNDSLKEKYALEVVSQTPEKTYLVILLPKGERLKGKVTTVDPPKVSAEKIALSISGKEKELEKKQSELLSLTGSIDSVSSEIERLTSEADLLLAGESAGKAAEDTIEVFTGFAPEECRKEVCAALDNAEGVYYIAEKAKAEDNPPIALKNNWFTRMFSVLTDMYGRPAYNEFDPTPYISVFFLLFFAMCMGDAGYGILLIIISFLLKKAKGAAKFAPLVLTLGIATVIVGFLLHTFFGIDISQVSWIPEGAKKFMITGKIAGYDAQMVLSLAIGVVHICIAMTVKAVYAVKKNGFANSLGTIGWTLLIVGGVIVGAIALGANLEKSLVKTIVIVLGIVSAIGIFLLNDIHRNPLKNIGSGLWETYNTVTGLLGDVLSYIRLYALGLAGGMLGAAFNQLGGMLLPEDGGFSVMWIFFILIVVFGHVLNLAMCCLGAFVHPLRLNFLEFFKNSGYEGSGKTYKPLTTNK